MVLYCMKIMLSFNENIIVEFQKCYPSLLTENNVSVCLSNSFFRVCIMHYVNYTLCMDCRYCSLCLGCNTNKAPQPQQAWWRTASCSSSLRHGWNRWVRKPASTGWQGQLWSHWNAFQVSWLRIQHSIIVILL